jgi:GAF domain-containing protein
MQAARISPPLSSRPPPTKSMPPKSLTTDEVVEFLSKLTSVQRATLFARVEKLLESRSAPSRSTAPAPKTKSDPPPSAKVVAPTRPVAEPLKPKAEPAPAMRPTLPSADVEDVVEPPRPPSSPPPPPSGPVARPPLANTEATAAKVPPPRASVPDIHEILFDAMHELNFFEGAVEGASFCLVTAMRVVPCLAGLVHLYDETSNEFVTVYAQGPRSERLLASRTPASDDLFARASRGRRGLVVTYGSEPGGETLSCSRHAFFGDPWSAAVIPVAKDGRLVAVFELIDPLDGAPFGEDAESAMVYIATHYADFLAQHGVEFGKIVAPPL